MVERFVFLQLMGDGLSGQFHLFAHKTVELVIRPELELVTVQRPIFMGLIVSEMMKRQFHVTLMRVKVFLSF